MRARILVIEDNRPFREQICHFLSCCDFEVLAAADGLEGLRMAKTGFPDVIICDVMMPGLDGFGLLEQLRADPASAFVPFIFVTAHAQGSDMRQGMTLGADDYLTKPFTIDELLTTIETHLARRRSVELSESEHCSKLRG